MASALLIGWSHNINAFSFRVHLFLRSRSLISYSCFSLVATSMTVVFCRMRSMGKTDRNSNVDQKLRTRTSERFNPIENGDRHCRTLNSISLVEGDGFSTCQQVYSHYYYRVFRIPPAFFTEFFVSGLAFCIRRNRVNDAILLTSLTATAQYLQESFL